MSVAVTCRVDELLYARPDAKHNIAATTREYTYKDETLIHMWFSNDISVCISGLINSALHRDIALGNEHFIIKKTDGPAKGAVCSRGVFFEKAKRLDMSQTSTVLEIVESYSYTDRKGRPDEVQFIITDKDGAMTAVIVFMDAEHCENFIGPPWLIFQNSPVPPQYTAAAP